MTTISYDAVQGEVDAIVVISKQNTIHNNKELLAVQLGLQLESVEAMLKSMEGPAGGAVSSFVGKTKVVIGMVPDKVSRNNHPWSVHAITDMVATHLSSGIIKMSRIIFWMGAADTLLLLPQGALYLRDCQGISTLFSKKEGSGQMDSFAILGRHGQSTRATGGRYQNGTCCRKRHSIGSPLMRHDSRRTHDHCLLGRVSSSGEIGKRNGTQCVVS
jgi:hypothetical protein